MPNERGDRLLSCSRSGQTQLWRADPKAGYVPEADALPVPLRGAEDDGSWRMELCAAGVLTLSARGGVTLLEWGGAAGVPLLADALPPLADTPSDALWVGGNGRRLLVVGMSETPGADGKRSLEVLQLRLPEPDAL
eukprot:2799289-Prymnesium_polylepis.1